MAGWLDGWMDAFLRTVSAPWRYRPPRPRSTGEQDSTTIAPRIDELDIATNTLPWQADSGWVTPLVEDGASRRFIWTWTNRWSGHIAAI
jgi:hypothetical protein